MTEKDLHAQQREEGYDLAQELAKKMNVMGNEKALVDGFLEGFLHSHRTLQASAIRVLMQFFHQYAKEDSDLRNEAAVAAAQKMSEATEDHHVPFI